MKVHKSMVMGYITSCKNLKILAGSKANLLFEKVTGYEDNNNAAIPAQINFPFKNVYGTKN